MSNFNRCLSLIVLLISLNACAWAAKQNTNVILSAPKAIVSDDSLYNACGLEGKSKSQLAIPVKLPFTRVFAGSITDYMVFTFGGPHKKEYSIKTERLTESGFSFLQTTGRSCNGQKPFVILYNTKTRQGFAIMLAYSGNWFMEVKPDGKKVKLLARTSPADLPTITEVGGLSVPGALTVEFSGHWDYGTLPIRRYVRKHLLRDLGDNWPLVQYNNWYASYRNLDEQTLSRAAKAAAEIGCELFTIDAGWYGKPGITSDIRGDYVVDKQKFPDGMESFASTVRRLGMKFGLWVEIETAAVITDIAKQHPDWALMPVRPGHERMVLDFGKPQVFDHAQAVIDGLMQRYDLDYIKMDFNSDPVTGSENRSGVDDPLYGHYRGLSDLWRHMRNTYPDLIIENCCSGSLRQDLMPAALTDTHWISDNVVNQYNLAIMFGVTYLFPAEICNHWTAYPEEQKFMQTFDVPSRFTINMMGHLGLSGKIWQWSEQTKKIAAERIAYYKKIRSIIRNSDVYHLTKQPVFDNPNAVTAVQYCDVESDRSLVFVFQANDPNLTTKLKLRALNPQKEYHLLLPPDLGDETLKIKGSQLMEQGVDVTFKKKGVSGIIEIR